jgi:hypothetical protein
VLGQFIVGLLVLLGIAAGVFVWFDIRSQAGSERYPITWFIVVCALFGALINSPFNNDDNAIMSKGHSHYLTFILAFILWKVSVAIVLAMALYLVFMSGLISGDLFPRFTVTTVGDGGAYTGMVDFMTKVKPEAHKDVAKILVWSFIAGYSETFVPNLISQLTSSAEGERREEPRAETSRQGTDSATA